MTDAEKSIADLFDDISSRCDSRARPAGLPRHEQVIWYVVSTRCEIDINGLEAVFDQLLSEQELLFLIDSLDRLFEPALAAAFRRCHTALREAAFFDVPGAMCHEFGSALENELSEVENLLQSKQAMWNLDRKLKNLLIN